MVIKIPREVPSAEPEDLFVEGEGQLPQKNEIPLDSELFELTELGARHWLAMDGWSLHEAALLLCGANPKRLEVFNADPCIYKPDFESCGYVGILDRLSRASEMGLLSFPAKPSDVCVWAAQKQHIPPPLVPALCLDPKATQAAATPTAGANSASSAQGSSKVWTTEKLAEVKKFREKNGTKKTAAHYGVSASRIRQLLPGDKPQPKGHSVFTHRTK